MGKQTGCSLKIGQNSIDYYYCPSLLCKSTIAVPIEMHKYQNDTYRSHERNNLCQTS